MMGTDKAPRPPPRHASIPVLIPKHVAPSLKRYADNQAVQTAVAAEPATRVDAASRERPASGIAARIESINITAGAAPLIPTSERGVPDRGTPTAATRTRMLTMIRPTTQP